MINHAYTVHFYVNPWVPISGMAFITFLLVRKDRKNGK